MSAFQSKYQDSNHKDIQVSRLKAEIFEMRKAQREYDELRVQLDQLERRYVLLQEEKSLNEREFNEKNDQNVKYIATLKIDLEPLKAELQKKDRRVAEFRRDLERLREASEKDHYEFSRRELELETLMADNSKVYGQKKSIDQNYRASKEDRMHELGEMEILERNHQELLEKNRILESRLIDIKEDIGVEEATLQSLEKEKLKLQREHQEKKEKIFKDQEFLDEKGNILRELENENKTYDRELDELKATINRIGKATSQQKSEDQELVNECGRVESMISQSLEEEASIKLKLEKSTGIYLALREEKEGLIAETEIYLQKVGELSQEIDQLMEGLKNIESVDQQVITLLTRKQRIKNLQLGVSQEVKSSRHDLDIISKIKKNVDEFDYL